MEQEEQDESKKIAFRFCREWYASPDLDTRVR